MRKLVVLNHKSRLSIDDAKNYIREIKDKIRDDLDVIITPSMCYLPLFYGKYRFMLGSQNFGIVNSTGEVSINQLKSMNVKYVIVGHSERKTLYNESYESINKKIKLLLANSIKPILCIGETIEERERRKTQDVLIKQIKNSLNGIKIDNDIIIAYEPVWAIGSAKTPSINEIREIVSLIKSVIFKLSNKNIKVLYGGSINQNNIQSFTKISELDGFIIGSSSTDVDKITYIMDNI